MCVFQVNEIYQEPSLGTNMNVVLVKIIMLSPSKVRHSKTHTLLKSCSSSIKHGEKPDTYVETCDVTVSGCVCSVPAVDLRGESSEKFGECLRMVVSPAEGAK